MFSGVFLRGVPGGALPTLKTGRRESVSWVQIPPHPLLGTAAGNRTPSTRRSTSKRWGAICGEDHSVKTVGDRELPPVHVTAGLEGNAFSSGHADYIRLP